MTEAKPSTVSRIIERLFALEPANEECSRRGDEDRIPAAAENERKLSNRGEGFFWTWQYPGQW
jgi:hypothetical protein